MGEYWSNLHLHFVLPAFPAGRLWRGGRGGGGNELGNFGQGADQGPHVAHDRRGPPPGLGRLLLLSLFDGAHLWKNECDEPSDTQIHHYAKYA